MSKKVSEFDRYERMKKLEKEAEVEKRKAEGTARKKGGKHKVAVGSSRGFDDDEYDY